MSRLFSLARKNLVLVFVFVLVSLVGTGLNNDIDRITSSETQGQSVGGGRNGATKVFKNGRKNPWVSEDDRIIDILCCRNDRDSYFF